MSGVMTDHEAQEVEKIDRALKELSNKSAILRQDKARIVARARMRQRRQPAGAE